MQLHTIYGDDLAKIQVNSELHYIEIVWLKHPESSVFRNIITSAFEYTQQHNITKWLCNMQQTDFLEIADQHWLVHEIFAAFNPEVKYEFAYVIRSMVLEVLTANYIYDLVELDEHLKEKLTISIFKDIESAHQWLFNEVN